MEIPISKGYSATVDEQDFDALSRMKWFAMVRKRADGTARVYAFRLDGSRGKRKPVWMHRLVLPGDMLVDHIDGNGLNNSRSNLRPATRVQNLQNSRKQGGTSSRWKGVYLEANKETKNRKWVASIYVNGKYCAIGRFREEFDAAQAYNFAAEEAFGEFARFNKAA